MLLDSPSDPRPVVKRKKLLTPTEYVHIIDEQYRKAKLERLSRFSVEWGTWSREMNLEMRRRTDNFYVNQAEGNDNQQTITLMKYVFNYWILRSQVLELFHKSSILHVGKRKKLISECNDLKRLILEEDQKAGSGGLPVDREEDIKSFVQRATDILF